MAAQAKPVQTTVRITEASEDLIQELAFTTQRSRSTVLRAILVVAARHQQEVTDLLNAQV